MSDSDPAGHSFDLTLSALTFRIVTRMIRLDRRALALFRISLGLLLLHDATDRLRNFAAHYTSGGIFPWAAYFGPEGIRSWSLNALSGSPIYQGALFGAAILLAVMVLVGLYARAAMFGSWIWLLSLDNFNPVLHHASDMVFRLVLFWAIWLPTADHFAIDAWRKPVAAPEGGHSVASVASAGLVVQIFLMYFCAALSKDRSSWSFAGNAAGWSLMLDDYSTPLGLKLFNFPKLTGALTVATWYTELFAPFLLISPFSEDWARLCGVLALAFLHLGMIPFLNLGMFPYVCLAALIALLPAPILQAIPFWKIDARAENFYRRISGKVALTFRATRRRGLPRLQAAALVALTLAILWTNLYTVEMVRFSPWRPLYAALDALGFSQGWGMFGAVGPSGRSWFVIRAVLDDGREVDLNNSGQPLRWEPPRNPSEQLTSNRWHTYWARVAGGYYTGIVDASYMRQSLARYADFLCRSAPDVPSGRKPVSLEFVWMRAPATNRSAVYRTTLLNWSCAQESP